MKVSRHSLISGLSSSLDIAAKNNLPHSKNTAYLSALICKEMGLGDETTLDIYYAALLHDIGESEEYFPYEHCEIGAGMLYNLPLSKEIPKYILFHHELYRRNDLQKLSGMYIPKGARIICFASEFDDMFGKSININPNLNFEINNWLNENRSLFDEEVTRAFENLFNREDFLPCYFNHETRNMSPETNLIKDEIYLGFEDIKQFALCFAGIVDRRCPFTYDHSIEIAKLAKKATALLGYDSEIQDKMYIAGLLHDIGKLHVNTDIFYKNDKLTPQEQYEIKQHPYYTRKILEQIEGFADIVEFASNHHERINGSGYPNHWGSPHLGKLEMIMAICDVYQTLTEERPYRISVSSERAWDLIDKMADNQHYDKALVKKLKNMFKKSLEQVA